MASTAYDLSAYTALPKEKPKPDLRVVRTPRRALAAAFTPKVMCAFALVVTLMSLIVYNQVCLNEVTGEINELNNQLQILENEQIRYISELETAMSRQTVAQIAEEELGMVKLDQYQIVYINLYEEDRITPNTNIQESGETGIAAMVGTAIDLVKEYIAGS